MKIEQENIQSMPALLCNDCGVDAQETKSLCCEAAGIIDPVSATAEALIPHKKLREAASIDATLIARERPPAQPVMGYKPLSQPDERVEYEKEFPVPEGLQYCANRDTYIRAAGSSPSDKFAREHYAYRAGHAAWMRRAWKKTEEFEQLKAHLGIYQTGHALLKEDVDRLAQALSTLLPYAENEAACINCEESADNAWAAVEEARELLELFNRQQPRAAQSASVEPAGRVAAAQEQESAPICSCPSGDGSLRWPCKVHPPIADGVGADPLYSPSNAQEANA
ncbi:hypothetical protein C4K14_2083 [Pseudomonas chlororaphis subsp. aureofaciens]|uniref:hypothetical protein n=1 Tax=Pseudomonas chlororaphis TaxID=587753 RepID=UPI000F702739|nr:hypothetical protein [Pseudomonas chlororaphis]AZD84917.1 hypothetical protein C4K14_2083 [Pseudomonas chlororaphis subsp. aureofaciens]